MKKVLVMLVVGALFSGFAAYTAGAARSAAAAAEKR